MLFIYTGVCIQIHLSDDLNISVGDWPAAVIIYNSHIGRYAQCSSCVVSESDTTTCTNN